MIDDKDQRIIEALKKDSRAPVREIAKNTGLRSSTVHNRIKHLKDSGVINKFTIKLDHKKIGDNFVVIILVAVKDYINPLVFKKEYIQDCYGVTGEYDLMLKCRFRNIEEFNKFIIEFRKDKNITKTHTLVATTTIKEVI